MFIRLPGGPFRQTVFPKGNRKRRGGGRIGFLLHQGGHMVLPDLRALLRPMPLGGQLSGFYKGDAQRLILKWKV